jgi:ABC-type sugar transport system, periplasmic component
MSNRRPEPQTTRVNRRSILRSIPAVGMAGLLAGCTGGDTDDAAGDDADPMSVEVLHGWTGGDGAKAAESLAAAWADQYPDITLEMNPIGGGGTRTWMRSSRTDCRATIRRDHSQTGRAPISAGMRVSSVRLTMCGQTLASRM